jgi:hypothetical protein
MGSISTVLVSRHFNQAVQAAEEDEDTGVQDEIGGGGGRGGVGGGGGRRADGESTFWYD